LSAAVNQPPPVHDLMANWDASLAMNGAGSVAPTAPPPMPLTPPSAESNVAHNHDVASWQPQMAPIGAGSAVAADPVAASPVSLPAVQPPAAAPTDASAAPVTPGSGLIQDNHDLASSLLQAFGGNEPILYSNTVPAAFIAPLHGSVHTPASTLAAEPHNPVAAPATPEAPPVVTPLSSGNPGAITAPGATPINDASYGAIVAASANPPALSGPGSVEFAAVLTLMQNFAQAAGPHLAILVSGNQVIEYDYFAIDYTPAAVSAVTYDFADGSHVSLVGLRFELPHVTV
jgi:hypothetical protein